MKITCNWKFSVRGYVFFVMIAGAGLEVYLLL